MNHMKRHWFPKKPICEGGVRGFTTISIAEVKPALIFLVMGFATSFVLFIFEVLAKIAVDYKKRYDDMRMRKMKGLRMIRKFNLKRIN